MSPELAVRLIGMVIFTVAGARFGLSIAAPPIGVETYALVMGLVGALVGLILTPYITTRPARLARRAVTELPAESLVTAVIGLIFGLIIGALFSVPLALLPPPFNSWMPTVVATVAAYLSVLLFGARAREIIQVARQIFRSDSGRDSTRRTGEYTRVGSSTGRDILMDTSVIIDGRILDISKTGFLPGKILVPGFVLRQLQHIADETDSGRRVRGRRGLTILEALQKESKVPVEIVDLDTDQARMVDDKLVILSKQTGAYLLTTDLNLNRTASLQGVDVLNINDLATAVRAVLLPGDIMPLKITAEGKEPGQGVGYLDDGTMVVVEDSRRHVDRTIYVKITRMIQTSAGKMYFAMLDDNPRKT